MRALIQTAFFLITLLGSKPTALASAGHDRGNGGDALICLEGESRQTVRFFDVYEAEYRFHMKPAFPQQEGLDQKVLTLIQRLEKVNPTRAKLYRHWYASFWKEANVLSNITLIDVPDTGMGFFPRGCRLEQLVVQQEPRFPTESRYTFNKDLWDQMDDNHRGATVLHELILREARLPENNHDTSEASRFLNATILSNQIEAMATQTFVEMLGKLRFAQADANGFSILLSNMNRVSFFGASQLRSAPLHHQWRLTLNGQVFEDSDEPSTAQQPSSFADARVVFFEDGQLAALDVEDLGKQVVFPVHLNQNDMKGILPATYVRFDSTGRVLDIRLGAGKSPTSNPGFFEAPTLRIHFDRLMPYEMKFLATNELSIHGLQCSSAQVLIEGEWRRVYNDLLLDADGVPRRFNLCRDTRAKSI